LEETILQMTQWNRAALRVAALAMAFALFSTAAAAAGNDRQAVLAANAQFYAALNKMFVGEVAPMEAVWSHAGDVTYMGPNGLFDRGWSAVLKTWQDQAAMKLGGRIEPAEMQVIVGRDLAVVTDYEEGENTNANGKVERVKLRATNSFRKEGGAWKMVGHHTDTLPYLAK
jgi:ketosteroid isomerase-like protein